MCLLSFVLTGLILFNYTAFCQFGTECVTLYNGEGICIYEMDCPPIEEYLQKKINKSLSNFAQQYLMDSSCGIVNDKNYICCSFKDIVASNIAAESDTRITAEGLLQLGKIEDVSNHPNLYLLPTSCGLASDNGVTDGQITSINDIPFLALLSYQTPEGLKFACGGTIINERYILTAVQCVNNAKGKLISVRVGEQVISASKECESDSGTEMCGPPVEDIDIEEVRSHPWHNRPTRFANNIAVIRLRRAINLENSNTKAVCLPRNNQTQYETLSNLLSAGWGFSIYNRKSDVLLKAILPVVDRNTCQSQYANTIILESHICAGGADNTDTCQGDSGGPVLSIGQVHNNSRIVQYGIFVAGYPACGLHNFPNIYTKVAYHMKWILDQMRP